MQRQELEALFYELEREGNRIRRWAENLEFVSGPDYGLPAGHKLREQFLDATAAMARASDELGSAALAIQRLISP
jgi:hypothetical protein